MRIWLLVMTMGVAYPGYGSEKKGPRKEVASTDIDFDGSLVEGKMKAPSGFFIQGRNGQDLSQMVKLRSSFKQKLLRSKETVSTIVK